MEICRHLFIPTLPGQKYLNKLKFVPQVAHDRDTRRYNPPGRVTNTLPGGISGPSEGLTFAFTTCI